MYKLIWEFCCCCCGVICEACCSVCVMVAIGWVFCIKHTHNSKKFVRKLANLFQNEKIKSDFSVVNFLVLILCGSSNESLETNSKVNNENFEELLFSGQSTCWRNITYFMAIKFNEVWSRAVFACASTKILLLHSFAALLEGSVFFQLCGHRIQTQ